MDLVTLIASCALSVEPKLMHALIFEQSGGEPWSFLRPGEALPRVLPTLGDAVREARAVRPLGVRIRVGLTGLPANPRAVTAALFTPCLNITLAARQITPFVELCAATSKPDPIYCAIAVFHGSWDRPDTRFAEAVRATVEKGNLPNFEMPQDAYFDANDLASDIRKSGPETATKPSLQMFDDPTHAWSSGLFPAKPIQRNSTMIDMTNGDGAAELRSPSGRVTATPATSKAVPDRLFVPLSSGRRP